MAKKTTYRRRKAQSKPTRNTAVNASISVEEAVKLAKEARDAAAFPMVFAEDADHESTARTTAQWQANLAAIGGWETAGPNLLRASTLFGSLAKAFQEFRHPGSKVIDLDQMRKARTVMEETCQFRVAMARGKTPGSATVADGVACA